VYELVTMKGGPKFKEATAAELKGEQGVGVHNRNLVATAESMAGLVGELSRQLQRVVVDKTGLTAKYNYKLSWSPDDAAPSPDATGPPDIFTALQEQLGLKLQPGKAEIDTFVVDHVELPSED
jgi:bla regulator protein BlaR1